MYERQDRRCRWSVAGIERYVVEGEVMEKDEAKLKFRLIVKPKIKVNPSFLRCLDIHVSRTKFVKCNI